MSTVDLLTLWIQKMCHVLMIPQGMITKLVPSPRDIQVVLGGVSHFFRKKNKVIVFFLKYDRITL